MLLAQKASQAFIAALLTWVSSKLPPTIACKRRSALAFGKACKREGLRIILPAGGAQVSKVNAIAKGFNHLHQVVICTHTVGARTSVLMPCQKRWPWLNLAQWPVPF
jgi:hypothetical protein